MTTSRSHGPICPRTRVAADLVAGLVSSRGRAAGSCGWRTATALPAGPFEPAIDRCSPECGRVDQQTRQPLGYVETATIRFDDRAPSDRRSRRAAWISIQYLG